MKNLKIVVGIIGLVFGLMIIIGSIVLPKELGHIFRILGVMLIIISIINFVIIGISQAYASKNIKDRDDFQVSMIKCPNCGTQLKIGTKVCPRCKTTINSQIIQGEKNGKNNNRNIHRE